ncbi:PilN domain-containing protein [Glaciecola sp. 1036]|uniref:PilN domain-containing protein n=1 Tax=Alteromonadaceae TaxID=72275 RepID=UPI003D0120E5
MKHQINLYHQEFRPHFEIFNAAHLTFVTLICALLIAIAYAGFSYQLNGQKDQLKATQARYSEVEQEIAGLSTQLAQRTGSPLLKAKLDRFTQDLTQHQLLVNKIQSISDLKNKSFSELFDAFSNSYTNDLWLTSFSVLENDLTIKGQLSNPSALPNWISKLSNTGFFKGQEFADAIVQRTDDILMFRLTSQPADAQVTENTNSDQGEGDVDGGN